MEKLTTQEILALAKFDENTLPTLVKSAFGKLMANYGREMDRTRVIDALKGEEISQ